MAEPITIGTGGGDAEERRLPSLISMMDLTGRVALVTGGAQGFGYACIARLAEAGASVLAVDRRDDAAARLTLVDDTSRGAVGFYRADITEVGAVEAAVDAALEQFGRIDIVVNNAGVFSNFLLENLEVAEFRRVMDVNVFSTYLMIQTSAAAMRAQGQGGSIVNISSIDAVRPSAPGLLHYDASKHAVLGMTKSAAIELGPDGIRVNAVAPGSAFTEGVQALLAGQAPEGHDVEAQFGAVAARTPLRRACDPDDVARAVLFLASDLASFITGTQIVVDGGFLQT